MGITKTIDSKKLDTDLINLANSLREKNNENNKLRFPEDFIQEINNINIDWDAYTSGEYPSGELRLETATTIGPFKFYGRKGITSIYAPMVTTVQYQAFRNCTGITSIYLPELITVGNTSSGGGQGFTFASCGKGVLEVLHLPKCKTAYYNYNFSSLGTSAKPITIVLPQLEACGDDVFRQSITTAIDLGPNFSKLPARSLYMGTYNNLILRRTDGIVVAAAANSLDSVNASTKVWVPENLIATYEEATNWSTKGSIFYPIEGSIYENAYADGTPINN